MCRGDHTDNLHVVQVDILCTHPMFGPDSGSGSWADLNLMYERVRIGHGEGRRRRADLFLQVSGFECTCGRVTELRCQHLMLNTVLSAARLSAWFIRCCTHS